MQLNNPINNNELVSYSCDYFECISNISDQQINQPILERIFNVVKQGFPRMHPVVASRFYRNLFQVGRKLDRIPTNASMRQILINDFQFHINLVYVASLCYLACFDFLLSSIVETRSLSKCSSEDMVEPVISLTFDLNIKIRGLIELLLTSAIFRYDFHNVDPELPEEPITLIDAIGRARFDFVVMQIQIIEKIVDSHSDWQQFFNGDNPDLTVDLKSLYSRSIELLEITIAEMEKREDILSDTQFYGFKSNQKYTIESLKKMSTLHKMLLDIESHESLIE